MNRKLWKAGKKSKRSKMLASSWSFFAGLGVGAAVGMMIAPKSGAELRNRVQDFARDSFEEGRERLQASIDPVVDAAGERAEQIRSQASNARKHVARKAAQVKEQVLHNSLLEILNDWPHERLIAIDGIGPVLASKIIQHRPYESEEELLAAKYLPPSAIESLRKAA